MSNQDIAVREHGALSTPMAPGFLDPATAATYLVESGVMGKTPKAQVVVRIMIGAELGVGPVTSARLIHTFDNAGRMVIELDATLMTALINNSGRYSYKEVRNDASGVELDFYDRGVKKGTASFGPDDAKRANLASKDNYVKYGRDMYFARAMSRGFDHYCADLGCGLPIFSKDEIDEMPMGHDQRKAIFALLKPYEMTDEERHGWATEVLRRDVLSFAEGHPSCPTRPEATVLIDWLADREDEPATAGEPVPQVSPEDSTGEGVMPHFNAGDGSAAWSPVGQEPTTDVPGGVGATKGQGTRQAPTPPAPTPEPSTLDVLMREYEDLLASGKRPKIIVTSWLASFLSEEKLLSMERADEEQAKRGLTWFQMQFRNWRAAS